MDLPSQNVDLTHFYPNTVYSYSIHVHVHKCWDYCALVAISMTWCFFTGGDYWYTLGLSLASIPAGSIMYYCHEWIWDRIR